MNNPKFLTSAAVALGLSVGAASAATYDLVFVIDESGSINSGDFESVGDSINAALSASLTAPVLAQDSYNITVIGFSTGAEVIVGPTLVNDVSDLTGITTAIENNSQSGGRTNYAAAMDLILNTTGTLTPGSAGSTINFTTDGAPNEPDDCVLQILICLDRLDPVEEAEKASDALRAAGWTSLNFEAVDLPGDPTDALNLLKDLTFGGGSEDNGVIISDPASITNPFTSPFVLEVGTYAEYETAIATKVARVVDPNPIPVPGALPLAAAGIGLFGFMGWRRRKA